MQCNGNQNNKWQTNTNTNLGNRTTSTEEIFCFTISTAPMQKNAFTHIQGDQQGFSKQMQ